MNAVDEDAKLDRREAAQVMRRAARMLRPYKRDVVGAGVLVTISTLAVLAGPFLLKVGIDRGISEGNATVLNLAVAAFVAVAAIAYAASRTQILMISRSGEGFLRDLRNRVFDHLLKLSMPFYDREKAGVVVSRMTSDVDSLQELIQQGLLQMLASVLLIVGSVVFLGIVSWQLLLVCLIPVPLVVLASVKFQRDSNEAYLTVRDRIGLTLSSLQEGISGVRVIQAYGREDVEIGRFRSRNDSLYRAHMKSVFVQAWYLPVIEGAAVGCTALVVAIGGKMVVDGTATVGTVAFFVLTLSNLFEPLQQLSQLFNTVQSSGAALQKLFELLDTPVDLEERPDAVALPDHGELRVEGLSFAYGDGPPVLAGVDLVLPVGEKLALVGPTGAGKSTLAKLMARLYDPTEGRVTFGGIDLRDAQLTSLRTQITVVPQEGYLFHGTIRDNVRIGRPGATDREVEDALSSLGLLARFQSQADGLDTEVNERGSSLSAGERQLVSLARAALADPAVLVLDEATSSLDPGTEVLVERALERLVEGRTVIVIAHRLSTAERSDRVGVVADGQLAELGTHAELVGRGGRYAQLYDSWVHGLASSG
jgi:ATP-binding cassette subfamily B protein